MLHDIDTCGKTYKSFLSVIYVANIITLIKILRNMLIVAYAMLKKHYNIYTWVASVINLFLA
jgi:hypothetical protein